MPDLSRGGSMTKKCFSLFFFTLCTGFLFSQNVEPTKKLKTLDASTIVYVMPNSKVYHLINCPKLGVSSGMTIKAAIEKGYIPCPDCMYENKEEKAVPDEILIKVLPTNKNIQTGTTDKPSKLEYEHDMERLSRLQIGNMMSMNKVKMNLYTQNMALSKEGEMLNNLEDYAFMNSPEKNSQIKKILKDISYINKAKCLYFSKNPVSIMKIKDKDCIIFNYAIDTVFNTLRTTPNKRLAEVLRVCVLSKMSVFQDELFKSEYPYYGIMITYGSRDFSDRSAFPSIEYECGLIFIDKNECAKFVKTEISENEFLSKSIIYLQDSGMEGEYKKVDIIID